MEQAVFFVKWLCSEEGTLGLWSCEGTLFDCLHGHFGSQWECAFDVNLPVVLA